MGSLHSQPSASLSLVELADWSRLLSLLLLLCRVPLRLREDGRRSSRCCRCGHAGDALLMRVQRCWAVCVSIALAVWLLPRNRPVCWPRRLTTRTAITHSAHKHGQQWGRGWRREGRASGAVESSGTVSHSGTAILTIRPSVVCFSCHLFVQASVNKESVDAGIKAVKMRKARYALFKVEQREALGQADDRSGSQRRLAAIRVPRSSSSRWSAMPATGDGLADLYLCQPGCHCCCLCPRCR